MWPPRALLLAVALGLAACAGGSEAAGEPAAPVGPTGPPVVPVIDAAMKARLRAVLAVGRARGNRDGVFAKVGDSNTVLPAFLHPIACDEVRYGRWSSLEPVVARWTATPVPAGWELEPCPVSNSMTRAGSASFAGWGTADLLRAHTPRSPECRPPDDIALRCELFQLKPSVALVMIGTNDMLVPDGRSIDPSGLERFRTNLPVIVREILEAGVIPVLSTLPPRTTPPFTGHLPASYNEVIVQTATEQQVPLWNFWRALRSVEHDLADGLHPAVSPTGAGDLRDEALEWGFNVRNLTALQVLEKVGRIVLDDGRPDA